MSPRQIKAKPPKRATHMEGDVAAVVRRNGAKAASVAHSRPDTLRQMGQQVLDGSRRFSGELARQARLHPLAVLGTAFAAGLIITSALWRRAGAR